MSEWISVKDKLPEVGKEVLTNYVAYPPIMEIWKQKVCRRYDERVKQILGPIDMIDENGFRVGRNQHVTHWQSLPKPPDHG